MKNYSDNQRWEPEFNLPAPSGPSGRNMKMSYCEMMQKNKPQSNSYAGGILILAAGGFHVAWLLWNMYFYTYTAEEMLSDAAIWFPVVCSWYIGTILGNVFGATLLTSWPKKHIYYLSGAFSTLSSILFIVCYDLTYAIVVGRLFAGMAYGMAYVTSITHGSENCVKEIRGRLISPINFILYSTIFTTTILLLYFSVDYSLFLLQQRMIGILTLILSLMGLAFTPFFTYESVTYLLYRNDERKALENMIKLRNESVMTESIKNDLEEMKLMVDQDRLKNRNIFADSNGRPLRTMLAISVIVAASSNLIVNYNLIYMTGAIGALTPIILVGARYIAGLVMLLFGDSIGRKKLLVISAGSSAAWLFLIQISPLVLGNYFSRFFEGILAIAFQICVGIGVGPMQHVLLSEAFSTAKKYWSIAFVTSIESLIQIVISGIYFIHGRFLLSLFLYISTGCIIMMTIYLQWQLPETRGMSLKQARDEFTKNGRPEGITHS